MTNYTMKFHRDVSEILDDNDGQCDNSIIRELFLEMIASLKLDKESDTVSNCRDTLNSNLRKTGAGVFALLSICVKSYFSTSKTINKVSMVLFNAACISNID